MTNLDCILKSRDITLPAKGPSSQSYGFSSSHVWMWELDHKENWAPKNWCFWTVVLKKTLESPLECKVIQPVSPKGNQSWIFIGRTDAEAETPILWPLEAKNWLIWKDPDAGKDRRQEKGTTKGEMVGWHHQLNEHEFEQALGVGDGQGSLACWCPWGSKESDTTEQLNWTELNEWEDYSNYFGEGVEISRNWATAHSLVFWQCLGTVMVPLGVSFSLLIEDQGLLKVHMSVILNPFDSCDLCCVLGLCHSVKSCALSLSLLLQRDWGWGDQFWDYSFWSQG